MATSTSVTLDFLRNMKRANDGELLLLDIFETEQRFSESSLVFLTETAFFLREGERLAILPVHSILEGDSEWQYLFFKSNISKELKTTIFSLLKSLAFDYQLLEAQYNTNFKQIPFVFESVLKGKFGC